MDTFKADKWVISLKQGGMIGTEALGVLSEGLGIRAPEIVFKESYVRISNEDLAVVYEINTLKALEMIGFEKRNAMLYSGGELKENSISMIPGELKAATAHRWQGKTVPKDSTFNEEESEQVPAKICDFGSDWTFSTVYKGHFEHSGSLRVDVTDECIPVERLGINNPILWGGEVIFYEAELDDCGQCKFGIRIRAMGDCFFALLRLYLRVDNVAVRIFDTRIFHGFENRYILREFQAKESTYEELREDGFILSSQWTTDPRQSDIVFEHLKMVHSFKDKITY